MHVYTPLWFRLGVLPIDASWTPALASPWRWYSWRACCCCRAGRDRRAAGLICAAALSPAVGFAIERGNADLLMFVLAALAGWTGGAPRADAAAGVPDRLAAAALKVYPATLLILALRERPALAWRSRSLSLAALLAYAAIDAAGLREMLAVVPGGTPFIYSFGARNLPAAWVSCSAGRRSVLDVVQAACSPHGGLRRRAAARAAPGGRRR